MGNRSKSLPALRIPAIAFVALALGLADRPALAAPLNALLDCPKAGPYRACLTVPVMPASEYDICALPLKPEPERRDFVVTGRLNGTAARRHRLAVTNKDFARTNPPDLAYLGQSPAGRAIILTDKGPLEILDGSWRAPEAPYYVVDERRWRIIGRLLDASAVVTAANDIGIWDEERQLCIAALAEPGRRLRVIESGCGARLPKPHERTDADRARETRDRMQNEIRNTIRVFAEWYASQSSSYTPPDEITEQTYQAAIEEPHYLGNVERAEVTLKQVQRLLPSEVNFEMGSDDSVASLFGGAGVGIEILRIKGSRLLVFAVSYDGDGC